MNKLFLVLWVLLSGLSFFPTASNAIEVFEFSTPEIEERFQFLTQELRCPKCQNQNLADSDSSISSDLRREIHFLLEDGQSDQYVKDFLVARYGSFVLYNPPVGGSTLWVWLIPVLFAFGASLLAWRVVLQASRRPIDDADEEFFEE